MAYVDKYEIGYSEQFSITGREERTEILNLNANADADSGNLSGTVTSNGTPVVGATVKVYDINDNPIEHTNTGGQGQYTITNIPAGSYKVLAIKDGYLLPSSIPVAIQKNKTATADIAIQADTDANKSAIFGIVRALTGEIPIQNVIVTLYSTVSGQDTLIGTVVSNSQGQYLFTNLASGNYYAKAAKAGYFTNQTAVVNVGTKEYISSDISLTADPQSNTGTVSGFINDKTTGLPIENALVAVYSISQGVEKIIGITKTSVSGRYLFANLIPGTYRIKATLQVEG